MERLLKTDVFKYIVAPMVSEITEIENIKEKKIEYEDLEWKNVILANRLTFMDDFKEYIEGDEFKDDEIIREIFTDDEIEEIVLDNIGGDYKDYIDLVELIKTLKITEFKKLQKKYRKSDKKQNRILLKLSQEINQLKTEYRKKYGSKAYSDSEDSDSSDSE